MRQGHLSEEIRSFQPSWTHWVALGAGLILSFLFLLGNRGLNEPDEGRYANIAQEMLEPEHSVLDPQTSDLGHYDKPPLIYWVTALSFRVWGLSEWAARLPSMAGAVMALVGLGWAAWRLYGNRCAWVAVLIGGTMVHVWVMARVLTPDMLLTGWCALAVAAWAESRHRGGDWRPWACQVFFWSMAWWTKATPMLIPLLGLVLYAWVNGGKLDRRALRLPWLLVFVFVLGCPWFVYMVRVHPELKDFFLHRELQGRMTGHVDGRHGPVYFYILTSMVTWLPWWPVALVALVRGWKSVEGSGRAIFKKLGPEFFLVGTGLCVFSLVSSKLQTYTLTLAPWVALVFARILLWRPGLSLAGMVRLALLMWVVYGTGALVAPFYEASWGRNSSMRPVALFLSARGAEVVYADRYWPGLEFYGHEAIYYVGVRPPLEISADAGRVSQHFAPRPQRGENAWFVHFRKQSADVFRAWLEDPAVEKFQLGDFVVGRIP